MHDVAKRDEMTTQIKADFIGDFALGDAIHQNLIILTKLYEAKAPSNVGDAPLEDQGHFFNKPIIMQIASICEAVLHDFFKRCKEHTREGSVRIDPAVLLEIQRLQEVKVQFGPLLKLIDRHEVFQTQRYAYPEFMDELSTLRNLRDRIHIALFRKPETGLPRNEFEAFSDAQVVGAEKVLEFILKVLAANHIRPEHARGFVGSFMLPWAEHLLPQQFYYAPVTQEEADELAAEYDDFIRDLYADDAPSLRDF